MPAWSVLTSAYLFRDADHLRRSSTAISAPTLKKMAEDQLGVNILGPTYFGTRQVGLKPTRRSDPGRHGRHQAPHAGRRRLAVPRQARSAPTRRRWPMPRSIPGCRLARSTARTTRCRTSQNMKFYEVMSQIVLTSHLVGYDLLDDVEQGLERYDRRPAEASRPPPTRRSPGAPTSISSRRRSSPSSSRSKGLKIYEPDVTAFRAHAQKMYLGSDLAKDWPKGLSRRSTRSDRASAGCRGLAATATMVALRLPLGTEARGERTGIAQGA